VPRTARDELLSPDQLAAELDVSPRTLPGWRLRGLGPPYVKVGALVRYRRSDVDAWLRAQRVATRSA
jgi:predicted DNA-binding transcriptional regulator AlpA